MLQSRFLYPQLFIWLALFIAALLCTPSYAMDKPVHENEYRAPLMSEPSSLDPAYYTDIYSMNVATNIFDGLLEFDQSLNIIPAIARRWKISRDHRTYSFQLREGVKFHNGREVTADDFVFSFSRILNPDSKSPLVSYFLNIKGAKAYHKGKSNTVSGLSTPDSYTLKIELKQPFAPFLSILAMVNAKVVPKEAVGPGFAQHPIGTGPFRFHSWKRDEEIVLEANTDYFAGRPFLETLRFRIYPNIEWEQVFNDFKKGLLDHALIPSQQYDQVISDPDTKNFYSIVSKSGLNLVYLGMNLDVPPFDDLRVRRAMNYAMDSEGIVKRITDRNSTPAKGILPPGIAGFDPNFKGYSYNPQRARELLAEAGYPDGKGFPVVEIWTASKSESVQQELQEHQRYLADIGIQSIIKNAKNGKEFISAIKNNKAAIFYLAWYADYPDPDNFFYPLFYSKSKTNRTGFHDPEIDQLMEQARVETNYLKRIKLYRKLETLIIYNTPIISQHINSNNYLFSTLG